MAERRITEAAWREVLSHPGGLATVRGILARDMAFALPDEAKRLLEAGDPLDVPALARALARGLAHPFDKAWHQMARMGVMSCTWAELLEEPQVRDRLRAIAFDAKQRGTPAIAATLWQALESERLHASAYLPSPLLAQIATLADPEGKWLAQHFGPGAVAFAPVPTC